MNIERGFAVDKIQSSVCEAMKQISHVAIFQS